MYSSKFLFSVTIAVILFSAVQSDVLPPPKISEPSEPKVPTTNDIDTTVKAVMSGNDVSGNVVSKECMKCLCNSVTRCDEDWGCSGGVCGMYRMTRPFWVDAGEVVLSGQYADEPNAFENCAVDPQCAAKTVQNYMAKYQLDRNNDGKVDCHDYAIIHYFGGPGSAGHVESPLTYSVKNCLEKANEIV